MSYYRDFPSIPLGYYTHTKRLATRSARPTDPPEPARDHPSWLRWALVCDLYDRFGPQAGDDRIYEIDLLLDRLGLSEPQKSEVYLKLSTSISVQWARERLREEITRNDPEKVQSFRTHLEEFTRLCAADDWSCWASPELREAANRVLTFLDRDWQTALPTIRPR